MSLFHDDFPLTTQLDVITALLILMLAGILLLALKLRNTSPVVSFGIFLFFAAHLLESTFVPLELVFEHRNYFASVGVLLLPVYAVFRMENYRALRLLPPILILMFAFMTATRAAEWGDRDLFQQMSIIEHPQSPRALNSFVNYLMSVDRYPDAIASLEKLIALTPTDIGAFLHLQLTQCAQGERNPAAMARAVELAEQHPMPVYGHSALQALTVTIVEDKCGGAVTVDDIEPVVKAAFDYAEQNQSYDNYYNLYRIRAMLAMKRGYYAQGYSDFRVAHELTGRIEVLHELMKYQILAARFQDADEILALMEQQNRQNWGIDTYVVEESRKLLRGARQRSENGIPPADTIPSTPAELPTAPQ